MSGASRRDTLRDYCPRHESAPRHIWIFEKGLRLDHGSKASKDGLDLRHKGSRWPNLVRAGEGGGGIGILIFYALVQQSGIQKDRIFVCLGMAGPSLVTCQPVLTCCPKVTQRAGLKS